MKSVIKALAIIYLFGSIVVSVAAQHAGGIQEGNTLLENRVPFTAVQVEKDENFTDICVMNPLSSAFDDIAILIRF